MDEQNVKELAIFEYEKNFIKYQDSIEQAGRRYKRALVNAYQQKLLEVERLCIEELEKIRENTSYLQSFKEIASQWSTNENNRGDSSRKCNEQVDGEQSKIVETDFDKNNWCPRLGKIDNEASGCVFNGESCFAIIIKFVNVIGVCPQSCLNLRASI